MGYEYLKKRELYNRAKTCVKKTLPPISTLRYLNYKGTEWLENGKCKIMAQQGGDWFQVSLQYYDSNCDDIVRTCNTFTGYDGTAYKHCY